MAQMHPHHHEGSTAFERIELKPNTMRDPREPRLILASNSPRRAALLIEAGYPFEVITPDRESGPLPGESAESLVARLATEKAEQVAEKLDSSAAGLFHEGKEATSHRRIIIAADTVAECDGEILGKPRDQDHARHMLRQLRGRTHRVLTGVCLWSLPGGAHHTQIDATTLHMSHLSDAEIEDYLSSGRWRGKAGAFGYQDGNDWVKIVLGSSSNVVGLPLELLAQMLSQFEQA